MKLDEIRPTVYSVTPRKYLPDHKRLIRSQRCEMVFIQEGAGDVRFGARRPAPFGAGSVLIMPPDTAYIIRAQGESAAGIAVSFDYDKDAADRDAASPRFENAPSLNEPLALNDVPDLACGVPAMLETFLRKEPHWQVRLSGIMAVMLARVAQHADGGMHALISQVIDLVTARYMEPLNNAEIASQLGYHPNYVNAVFVRDMGMSLHQYLMRYRVEMATHLLLTTTLPISSIAEQVGFRHFSHFSNCFHRLTGVAPAAYRLER